MNEQYISFPSWDLREFSNSKTFGTIDTVPDFRFVVSEPLKVRNQGATDDCLSYAVSSAAEDKRGKLFEPLYSRAKENLLSGSTVGYGVDPDIAFKAGTECGFLEESLVPSDIQSKGRMYMIQPSSWTADLDAQAIKEKFGSYFKVDGYKDTFTAIRATLWQHIQLGDKCSVVAGIVWEKAWDSLPGGVIEDHVSGSSSYNHAIKIYGQDMINGKTYLLCLPWHGDAVGAGGKFFLSEKIANEIIFARIFKDISPDEIKSTWNFIQKFYDFLVGLLRGVRLLR